MHDVYIIPGVTGEEQFRKDAYKRIREGDGFTTFHHHPAKTTIGLPKMDVPCTTACVNNNPYPGHNYLKTEPGVPRMHPETCAVFQQLDPLFYQTGNPPALGHCINCHCTCFVPELDVVEEKDQACLQHERCPACSR